MKKILILIFISYFISSCTTTDKIISNNVYDIANYNYTSLSYANKQPQRYLLIDKDGYTSKKDLFIYINNLKADYMKDSMTIQMLINYNKKIMDKYNENTNNKSK